MKRNITITMDLSDAIGLCDLLNNIMANSKEERPGYLKIKAQYLWRAGIITTAMHILCEAIDE